MYLNLTTTYINFKVRFVNLIHDLNLGIAKKFFNYPEVPGMLAAKNLSMSEISMEDYIAKLPVHEAYAPPIPAPKTLLQALFGNVPELAKVNRGYYKATDAHFGFYIPNFKNIWFFPDSVSQFIQVQFDITNDISTLVVLQEVLFVIILSYYFLIEFRTKLYWFLTINPYTRPLIYLLSMTDWLLDFTAGFFPVTFSIDYSPTILMMLLGKVADSLNHLVFTMPYVPSEGKYGIIKEQGKEIKAIVFRFFPITWEKYPIPNKLREYWYYKRPDVFKYLEKKYKMKEIDFKPDNVLKQIYDKQHMTQTIHENLDNINHFSTNVISDISLNLHHHYNIKHYIFNSIDLHSNIFHIIN